MNQMPGEGRGEAVAFRAVGRCLLPLQAPNCHQYFLDHLRVSHGYRDRLRRCFRAGSLPPHGTGKVAHSSTWTLSARGGILSLSHGSRESLDGTGWDHALPLLQELLEHQSLLEGLGLGGFPFRRAIILNDHENADRGRVLVFPFYDDERRPRAVVKLRDPKGGGRSLGIECDSLNWVRSRMGDPSLRQTVPEAFAYRATPGAEILILGVLEGRSAYVEQQNRLFDGGWMRLHMETAADWLGRLHTELALDLSNARGPSHGDFWARNLLLRTGGPGGEMAAGVVDWECFDPQGPMDHDLFHFPITYAQNHPAAGSRRASLSAAFNRGFLRSTRLSRAIRRYFARYCFRTGLEPRTLEARCRTYLRARSGEAGGEPSHGWLECLELLGRSPWVISP